MSNIKQESELAALVASFYDNPLGFVLAMYPWGEPILPDGSLNPLRDKKGPEPWQRELLIAIGEHSRNNGILKSLGLEMLVWRSAISSGHGVGKSAIVSWIIQWLMSTRVDTRMAITASTQHQLEDKTWPELGKWHKLLLNRHWFTWSASSYWFASYPEEQRKNYRATAATVSKDNTEAFAGLHNEGKTVAVLFDEASGVDSKVWEVSEGALTDGEGWFLAFGNPTKSDGEFPDCFDKHADMYYTRQIDSRSISFTNKSALGDIIQKYGDDSDEVKVRIKGQFPSQSFNGFITIDGVHDAINRDLVLDFEAALIMAIDVSRFGDDETVIGYRQGRDARSRKMRTFRGLSTMKLADIIAQEASSSQPDAIVIEATGPGAGVIDRLRDLGWKVFEVHPGARAQEFNLYMNRRAEYWSKMRDWIYEEGCISEDEDLVRQLTTILYSLDRHEQRTLLEAKRDMKTRGLPSPDRADTLALTFAVNIARRDRSRARTSKTSRMATLDNDPLGFGGTNGTGQTSEGQW